MKELLLAALAPYDPDGMFDVEVVSDTSRELNAFTVQVSPKGEIPEGDGLKALDFLEKVEIAEAYIDADQLTSLGEAIDAVTKEKEKNQTYEVQAGDTLSVIANSRGYYVDEVLALNPGLTRDAMLQIGDEIIISVPEPELSISSTVQSTYEEDYFAETQYIDNDSWYTTERVVRQEPAAGHHEVTVLAAMKNQTSSRLQEVRLLPHSNGAGAVCTRELTGRRRQERQFELPAAVPWSAPAGPAAMGIVSPCAIRTAGRHGTRI